MCESAQTGFNASQYHWHIGIEFLQYAGVDYCGVFGTHIMTAIWTIGILTSEAACSSVFVHHAVHTTRCNAKPKTRATKTFEVSVIAMPRRLWHNADPQPFCFKQSANDSGTKAGMVHISIGTEENDIRTVPTAKFHLLARCGQPV